MTPNPMAMKFVADRLLLPEGVQFEFLSRDEAGVSPLALKLFDLPFVKGVYMATNFITVLKNNKAMWDDVVFDVRDYIKDFIVNGGTIWNKEADKKASESGNASIKDQLVMHAEATNETEQKIIDTLETYVKPAVENDGGLILFRSFEDGVVTLQLKGSCSGCPSSSLTLKSAVEQLLKRMVPEVKEVQQEMA
jgi:Fe-S cluster biogenesis protein NfuA